MATLQEIEEKGRDLENFARALFEHYAPGEDWNRNRASYLAIAQRVLSGEQTQIGGESVAPFLQQYQQQASAVNTAVGATPPGSPAPTVGGAPPSTQTTPSQLSTGDPELDKFLNGDFLNAVKDQLGGDPLAVYRALNNPAILKAAIDRAGVAYGETFTLAKERIQQSSQLQQDRIGLRRSEQLAELGSRETELGVKKGRTEEDLGTALKREVRNLQQATQETADSYASAGRAFGGGRIRAEEKLSEASAERTGALQQGASRTLEDIARQQGDITTQRGFAEQQYGVGGLEQRQLKSAQEEQFGNLEAQRRELGAFEVQNLRNLAGELLRNPQFTGRSLT